MSTQRGAVGVIVAGLPEPVRSVQRSGRERGLRRAGRAEGRNQGLALVLLGHVQKVNPSAGFAGTGHHD